RQDIADDHGESERAPALHQRSELARGALDAPALRDVVDPALDDERVCARDGRVEARGDLVGALAPPAVVQELELAMPQRGPVLPAAVLVAAPPARVPVRRALGDRVAEARDAH